MRRGGFLLLILLGVVIGGTGLVLSEGNDTPVNSGSDGDTGETLLPGILSEWIHRVFPVHQ